MTPTATISADLLTPLGAYLRLREAGRASFLLESVERGRLGRNSWMGAGSEIVTFDEAESIDRPLVGYLAYDHAAKLEPTVPLPAEGRSFPEKLASCMWRPLRALRPRRRHGDRARRRRRGDRRPSSGRHSVATRTAWNLGTAAAVPRARPLRGDGAHLQEHIVAGDAFQIVPSQRAERPTSATALDLYRALRRVNPSPYLFLLDLDELALMGPRRAARRLRAGPGKPRPDRGHDRADGG